MIFGTTSSTGVSFGSVFLLEDIDNPLNNVKLNKFSVKKELDKFDKALKVCLKDLIKIKQEVRLKIGEKEEKIFESQSNIINDPLFINAVKDKIIKEHLEASESLKNKIVELEQQYIKVEDKSTRQTIADIKDVGSRIIRQLEDEKSQVMRDLNKPVVLVARELSPHQAIQLNKDKISAIITEKGGINSHASIIARSLDIPAIVGVRNLIQKAKKAKTVIVDGFSGSIYFNPNKTLIKKYEDLKADYALKKESLTFNEPIQTKDGKKIFLYANIGKLSELNSLKEQTIEGVGLLRTEYLLMNRNTPPSLEELSSNLKTALDFIYPLPVNIRLLDIGGEKTIPFFSHPKENNPNLGTRGIRFLLRNPHILRTEIQSILEASEAGNPRILIPMVTTINEIHEFISLLRRMEVELSEQGKNIKTQLPVGIMIETPAVALLADKFAKEVNFFSIGTNDLAQYTLAADRENEYVKDIYDCINPAVLKLIKNCIKGANKAGIEITICGEMAASLRAIPILLGMGIERLSIDTNQLEKVKEIVCKINLTKAKKLAKKALRTSDVSEIIKIVNKFLKEHELLKTS